MDRLPSPEERQWLTDALRDLLARQGGGLLDAAPLVEPTNEWFPEKWASTVVHGHRLAQRLMHYAGLGELRVFLSAYEPSSKVGEETPWDAGTAGWFAGIRERRAYFGLHVREFNDPEAAAGVLAHEVAHAWRRHHGLVVDDRDDEEPLTDLTTVVLGFGILSTNNTDRYRSSGNWSETRWSMSSAGYLSPQAMSWLLAVWCAARGEAGERRAIERHLEPNQRSYFRAGLEELDRSASSARELLGAAGQRSPQVLEIDPESFVPREPALDELDEPEQPAVDPQRNRGTVVYQRPRGDMWLTGLMAAFGAFLITFLAVMSIDDRAPERGAAMAALGAAVGALLAARRARRPACSACKAHLDGSPAICPGCGGTVGARVSGRELRRLREEELERRAALDTGYEDCDACEPEVPCARHAATFAIGDRSGDDGEEHSGKPLPGAMTFPRARRKPVSGRFLRKAGAVAAIAGGALVALALWRQNHVAVYFDNPLASPVTVSVDGERFAIIGRPPVERTLKPGKHHVVVTGPNGEIERTDVDVERQPLPEAVIGPGFYVYSIAARGIYQRSWLVYSSYKIEHGSTSKVIAMRRWIREDGVDFLFTKPPDQITRTGSGSITRGAFEVTGLSPREAAWTLDQQGQTDDAAGVLHQAIALDPCDEGTRQDLVDILTARKREDDVRREATAWVTACGTSVEAHRTYQNLLREAGEKETLLTIYRERLRKDPSAINHYLYGRLLNGQPAIAEYTEALRLDPGVPWARAALGLELLEAEQDAAAYGLLDEALRAPQVGPNAAVYFAMAAIATGKQDEALARLPEAKGADSDSIWAAKWLLTRSKGDWSAARILLAYREVEQQTAETKILRARLERDAGGAADGLAEDLDGNLETRAAAVQLRFETAWETGHLREAATMDLTRLHADNKVDVTDIYAVEAAMLAHLPEEPAQAASLRAKLSKTPTLLAILDAAEGRISKETVMSRIADNGTLIPHAWFALAVHASLSGGDAAALFRKSAERALDREFPYRLAMHMATAQAASARP